MTLTPTRLTLLIPCKNERQNLAACVQSVGDLPDEVLLADSGSTDGTLELAGRLGCRVVERAYRTSGDFKNWAIPQAAGEWVLLLDADERATPELVAEVRAILQDPQHDGYWIYRQNHWMGHALRHGPWGRDTVLRLFRRDAGRYVGPTDHAEVEVGAGTTGRLKSRLIHYTAWSYAQYLPKVLRYADVQSKLWDEAGRRASRWQLLTRAPLRFLQGYLLQRGFLDGAAGIQVCVLSAYQSYLKQARLWERQQARRQSELESAEVVPVLRPAIAATAAGQRVPQTAQDSSRAEPGPTASEPPASEVPRTPSRTLRSLRKRLFPRWMDLQARRQLRDVIMRRLGIARSHRPMLLVQNPELAVSRLLRPIVAHELLANPDFTFLQIGAYDGVGDDDLRELIQEFQLRGLLVEPQPEAFARLEATYADQPQVSLLRAAIDRTAGTRTLYRPAGGDSMVASFDRQHLSRHGIATADIVGEPVPCHTIGSALATAGLEQVDLIQIDAEGYDDTIIQSIDFRRVRPAILRFEYHHLGSTRADACLKLLSAHGYRFLMEEKDVVAWRRADRAAIQAAA